MRSRWFAGNSARLLENGEEYYPAVFDAIRAAKREVLLETFILWEDKVGQELHAALVDAARRGVRVDVLVDGFGSPDLSPEFIGALTSAGARLRVFAPVSPLYKWFGIRVFNLLRRMHRKILVVDGERAFVGGINYSADHLLDFGPQAKQDYAVELTGPIVEEIHRFATAEAAGGSGWRARYEARRRGRARAALPATGDVEAMFVTRDNHRSRFDIERLYRIAIRKATKRVWIANAYFFPGYRLLREMRHAARRGVDVRLILQGEPDMPIVKTAASLLYEHLQRDGVKIHEYCTRPLHGKVAVVDDEWATVGSSNLDPLSLSLNLEANVMLKSRSFAQELGDRLQRLIDDECTEIGPLPRPRFPLWQDLRWTVVFHVLRRFPDWARLLPRHVPRLHVEEPLPPGPAAPPDEGDRQQRPQADAADAPHREGDRYQPPPRAEAPGRAQAEGDRYERPRDDAARRPPPQGVGQEERWNAR
jgi:cardiolipin synthase